MLLTLFSHSLKNWKKRKPTGYGGNIERYVLESDYEAYNTLIYSSIILSVRFSLAPGVVLLFSNLLFIKVSYELVKRQILCLVGFPKLLHHLKI